MSEATPDSGESSPKRVLSPQLIVLALQVVATLAALGAAVYTKLLFKRPVITDSAELEIQKQQAETDRKLQDRARREGLPRVLIDLGEMKLNLLSEGNRTPVIVIQPTVECLDEEAAQHFRAQQAAATDKLVSILNRRTPQSLSDSQGRVLLKEELIRAFNDILKESAVTDIYFGQLLIQN